MSVRKDEIHVATLRELAEAHVEIARLTKALDERDADMHARIRAGYALLALTASGCHAVDWRARAIAAEANAHDAHLRAARLGSVVAHVVDAVGAKARGAGGQTVEAMAAAEQADMLKRIDRMRDAAARWAKVAPLIERLRHTRRHAKPDIVVTALDNLLAATEATP